MTGVAGVTEEVHVERTGTTGCSGDPESTAINTSRRSCVCRCRSTSCFWCSHISFRYLRIFGWFSGNAEVNKLRRTEDTRCKGLHATRVICGDSQAIG